MPAISRENDTLVTGHGCSYVSTLQSGAQTGNSSNVYVNGRGVSAVGDPITVHSKPGSGGCVSCSAVTLAGSSTVFINNKAVVRIGDDADQNGPGVMSGGSGNVFAN